MELKFNHKVINFETKLTLGELIDIANLKDSCGVLEIGDSFKSFAIQNYNSLSAINKMRFFRYNYQMAYIVFRTKFKEISEAYGKDIDFLINLTSDIFDDIKNCDISDIAKTISTDFARNYILIEPKIESEVGFTPDLFPVSGNEKETLTESMESQGQ